MKYLGWFLLLLALAVGGVFYFQSFKPLRKENLGLREEISLWMDRVKALTSKGSPQAEARGEVFVLSQDELFKGYESLELTPEGERKLKEIAQSLRSRPGRVLVSGHTDSVPIGPSLRERYPSNWELSAVRASAVARFLMSCEIGPSRFAIQAYGPSRPVAENSTEGGRAKNRRIEIQVIE
jgi:flagellar motor protein MotB